MATYSEYSTDPQALLQHECKMIDKSLLQRIGLINSGGESLGDGDREKAIKTVIMSRRARRQGLISGRKDCQRRSLSE